MKNQVLIRRYTHGLVDALRDDREFAAVKKALHDFRELLRSHESLASVLSSPFIPRKKRFEILRDILGRLTSEEKAGRFISLLLEKNRMGLLESILASLDVFWKEKKGILTIEVSSVIPLTDEQKKRLQERMEMLEGCPVHLTFRIDPELLGGICLRRGNLVYDVSLRGHLDRLRERIYEG
jgi:F-type H+-transporting ATPase subunit delta